MFWIPLGPQWLRLRASTVGGVGAKILPATQRSQSMHKNRDACSLWQVVAKVKKFPTVLTLLQKSQRNSVAEVCGCEACLRG